jgi:AcrR family transcriptional regulator
MSAASTAPKADQVVAIAARVLAADGIDQFVMRRIADLADMKLGNLQYYFATRDDLLEAVVRFEFAEDLATVGAIVEDDPVRRLAGVVAALSRRWTAHNGSIYLSIGVLALHNDRFTDVIAEIYDQFHALMADLVRTIDPSVTPAVARRRAFLMTSVLDGASVQPGRNDPGISGSLVDDVTQLVTSIARGR